jgi:hypothetical protein
MLPSGYYALPEQHAGQTIPDILTLQAPPPRTPRVPPDSNGGVAVAEAPPQVQRRLAADAAARSLRRTLAIRHVSGHRIVALLEIVSPANKDRTEHIEEFAAKVDTALFQGIHVMVVDLLPPGRHDSLGMHGAIWKLFQEEPYDLPAAQPLTLASYVAGRRPEAYIQHLSLGEPLIDMPLFLTTERYINVPLEPTYMAAYRGMPEFWREVIEGKRTI